MKFDHILHVGPYSKKLKGGINQVLFSYRKSFREEFNGFNTIWFNNTILNTIFFPFIVLKFIFHLLIHPKLKIIHFHSASNGSFYRKSVLFLVAKLFKKICVIQIHGGLFLDFYYKKFNKKIVELILSRSNAVLFLSKNQKNALESQIKLKNTFLTNNIISDRPYRKIDVVDKVDLLFLGKIVKEKGVYDILDVMAKYRFEWKDKVKLTIAGEGENNILLNKIMKLKIQSNVNFVGWVTGKEKHQLFLNSNVFILPSYIEAMPVSILEAMSYGMPIIGTKVGGIPNLISPSENGFLINLKSHEELFSSINHYVTNGDDINIHGKKSYNFSEKFFPKNLMIHLQKIYNSI